MRNDPDNNVAYGMQQVFVALAPLRDSMLANGMNFWRNQKKLLDITQEFAEGWFDRRHEAAMTAIEAIRRANEASSPADAVREFQSWMLGSVQRVAADCVSCQKHMMQAVELAAQPVNGGGNTVGKSAARRADAQDAAPAKAA